MPHITIHSVFTESQVTVDNDTDTPARTLVGKNFICAQSHLLRRNIKRHRPQVDLRVALDARQDKEDTCTQAVNTVTFLTEFITSHSQRAA